MNAKYKPEGMIIHTAENRASLSCRATIERAVASGVILEETALMCDSELNLHFDLGGIRGIMPRSEVLLRRNGEDIKDIAVITRVGKPVCFKVTGISHKNGEPCAVLSRREAQKECMLNYLADLIPGDVVRIKITHLENFGAFADIGCGICALIPVDCLSVSRISHPRDRLACGCYTYAVVRSIDETNGRIFLTRKELLGTWEENAAKFSPGQTVAGIVRSIENYGVFVELAPNLAGLAERKDGEEDEGYSVGDVAAVYVKSIIPERMKVKLILIDTHAPSGEAPREQLFVDCEKTAHVSEWNYSPACAQRTVRTVF